MLTEIIIGILALLGAIGTAWGYRQGGKNAKAKTTQSNLDAANKAKENRHEMESQDDERIVDILTGRVRDGR